ncbi:LOW QUALITY PROTEIN: late lactation protein B-like [Dromiciops gliroides]|uniref:LOW QUALITY PROTEIN: late lactation protein B-like n=1 Tax=Dromiciops gliroides TaxID=33562 RepID=UPI001CC73E30|nr:LOW QUALITY PROTEIN: late lactation protein B-like [Dromiciops gliroides]
MKVLFLTIVLSLCSILQAQESASYEEGFEGTYFIKAVVADKEILGEKKPKDIVTLRRTDLSNGNLEAKFTINILGKCKEIKMILEKTDEPGVFSMGDFQQGSPYIQDRASPVLQVIFFVKMQKRTQKAFEDYKKFVSLKGFKEEKIQIPRQTGADDFLQPQKSMLSRKPSHILSDKLFFVFACCIIFSL